MTYDFNRKGTDKMNRLADYHIHTFFSGDSEAKTDEIVKNSSYSRDEVETIIKKWKDKQSRG